MRTRTNSRAGFTLVEVMITLLIMSLMLVAITQVLTGARRTRDVIFNITESQLAGPAILDLLEKDLRGMFVMDRKVLDILRVQDRAISGMDADRLDFVTSSNSRTLTPNAQRTRFLRADVTEVGYCLRANPDFSGEFLEIYRRESFGIDETPFLSGNYTFLHDRVRRFDIQVFDEDGVDGEPLDSWGLEQGSTDERGLPRRIEIELEVELSPRLINEQSSRLASAQRRVLYRRIIHFPASLHLAMEIRPVPRIPVIEPPSNSAANGNGGGGGGGGGGGQGVFGGGQDGDKGVTPLFGPGGAVETLDGLPGGGGGAGGNIFGGGG